MSLLLFTESLVALILQYKNHQIFTFLFAIFHNFVVSYRNQDRKITRATCTSKFQWRKVEKLVTSMKYKCLKLNTLTKSVNRTIFEKNKK